MLYFYGKASVYNAGDPGLSPGLGRSPGEGNGNPLQYSCLENPMDRGAWLATVYGVTKSRAQLSDFNSLLYTLSVRAQTHLPKFLETSLNKGRERQSKLTHDSYALSLGS